MRQILILASLWLLVAGCTASDPDLDVQRARYVLSTEPQGAVGVLDIRETLEGESDVVVVGRIGGIADPWTRGLATFVIADPAAGLVADNHDEECDCPFCVQATDETDSLALIQFVDDSGEVLSIDAQTLFRISSDQTVVVSGQARLDELGHLVVSASGLYVRR